MSLYVYSGVPGSGKTYHAVKDISQSRAPVVTNISVRGLGHVAVLGVDEITPRLLMAYSSYYFRAHEYRENELLLVIDEAQLLFNSRKWNDADRFAWLEFLSQHRKYGYRVIFIAQSIEMIDKQFRCLCEFDVRHTAASSISLFTRFLSKFGVRATCANYYYFDSDTRIAREIFYISKRYYDLYDTAQDITAPELLDVDISPILSRLGCGCARDAPSAPAHRTGRGDMPRFSAARAPDP